MEEVRIVPMLPMVPDSLRSLHRIHHARSLNRRRPAPLRGIWDFCAGEMEGIIREEADRGAGLCVIWNNFSLPYFEPATIRQWQRQYHISTVLYFVDRMDSYYAAQARMYLSELQFDLIYTYFRMDAEAYHLRYFDAYYSRMPIPPNQESDQATDLYFWGSDMGRRGIIEDVVRRVHQLHRSAEVGICYAQGEGGRLEGITYDQPRAYAELLAGALRSRVLLDIVSDRGGVSLRYYEAIVYGKRLLSNNPEVRRMRFYTPEQVVVFQSASDITEDVFTGDFRSQPYADQFSPVHWIRELEAALA